MPKSDDSVGISFLYNTGTAQESDRTAGRGGQDDHVADDDDWAELATMMLDADQVTVVGIAPPCLLMGIAKEIEQRRELRIPIRPIEISYLTPRQELAPPDSLPTAASRYVRLWQYGLKRMTRLMETLAGPGQSKGGTAHAFKIPFSDCMIEIRRGEADPMIHLLTSLPIPEDTRKEGYTVWSRLGNMSGNASNWISQLRVVAKPVVLREVQCNRIELNSSPVEKTRPRLESAGLRNRTEVHSALDEPVLPELEITRLSMIGQRNQRDGALLPIAIVIPRVIREEEGPSVLLHWRDRLWEEVDTCRYSLPSARVQDIDIARSLRVDPPGSRLQITQAFFNLKLKAQESLNLKEKDPFVMPLEAFGYAAQRAVSRHLGLAVEPDKLKFQGFRMLEHEDGHQKQNGYAVYLLDLTVSDTEDEVDFVIRSSPVAVEEIPVAELFPQDPEVNPRKLNRLLEREAAWLEQLCLRDQGA